MILVCLGVGLAAVLIAAGALGLVDTVGEVFSSASEEEPASVDDAAAADCMDKHAVGGFGASTDFTCDMPCITCHSDGI